MAIKYYAHKEQGIRPYQQDEVFFEGNGFGVADGMGGHANGHLAAAYVKHAFEESFKDPDQDRILYKIAWDAHVSCRVSMDNRGSTYVGAKYVKANSTVEFGWVGDSHLYLVNSKGANRLTVPHEAPNPRYPSNPLLTSCIGQMDEYGEGKVEVEAGDFLVAITDGLEVLPEHQLFGWIQAAIKSGINPAQRLCNLAINKYGSTDNCGVVIAEITDD